MDMNELYKVEEIAMKELKSVTENGKFRSREEIDNVYKLMDILKDIKCFEDEEYSENDERSYDSRSYDGRGSYEGGSYRGSYRGRGRNARRDSMGRYASEGSYRGGSYRYSRDGKQDFVAQLEELMEEAPDEQTKKNIQRMVNDLG